MSGSPSRQAIRVPYGARLLVRGACGCFAATGVEVSTTGLRLRLEPEVLHLEPGADLGTAAACVQTRVGSRFAVDLGLTAAGRGRVRKSLELIRLAVHADALELGCRFDAPLTAQESRDLGIAGEHDAAHDEAEVRTHASWGDQGRATLDPTLRQDKVEHLLDVPLVAPRWRDGTRAAGGLRVLVRPCGTAGRAPLVGRAEGLGEGTLRMHVTAEAVRDLGAEPGDFPAILESLAQAYGTWPTLELLDGTRRVWVGSAHTAALEVDERMAGGAILRFALARRLQPAEVERLCHAAR